MEVLPVDNAYLERQAEIGFAHWPSPTPSDPSPLLMCHYCNCKQHLFPNLLFAYCGTCYGYFCENCVNENDHECSEAEPKPTFTNKAFIAYGKKMGFDMDKHRPTFSDRMVTPPTVVDGRHGLLLDTGAVYNLHGDYWRRRYSDVLKELHLRTKVERNIATFSGIGGKPVVSTRLVHFPICIEGKCGTFILQDMEGSETPAIVGLNGMEAQKMMIVPHDDVVIMPNGGKVKISMSKEVKVIKCMRSPSGHLLLPCDQFDMEGNTSSSSGSMTLFRGELSACKEADEPSE